MPSTRFPGRAGFPHYLLAPLEGWRHVKVSDRHTAIDYAHTFRDLSDRHFPNAAKIVMVQDNLNTHKPTSLSSLTSRSDQLYNCTGFVREPNKV
jgi:hypothetical protein